LYCLGLSTHLFAKIPRPGDSEGIFSVFESSFYLCYYQSNHSKVGAISGCLAQGHNKRACRPIFTLRFKFF